MTPGTRESVIATAYGWVGTPYEHSQRLKGPDGGVDCGQLLAAVYEEAGCIPHVETDYYPRDFHLHRDREWYMEFLQRFGRQLDQNELPQSADAVIYRIGRIYSHGGIVVAWPWIIHSFVTKGVILVDGTIGYMKDKPRLFFRPTIFET